MTREWKLFASPYGLLEQYILSFRSPDTQKLALGIHIKSGKKKLKIVSPARFLFHPILYPDTSVALEQALPRVWGWELLLARRLILLLRRGL